MGNINSENRNSLVYPGAYVPMSVKEKAEAGLKIFSKNKKSLPQMNLTEMADSFVVEIAARHKREEFVVKADGNILCVGLIHKEQMLSKRKNFPLNEFNCSGFDRHVVLPQNTDSEFISAEYKEGILRFLCQKNPHILAAIITHPSLFINTQIL